MTGIITDQGTLDALSVALAAQDAAMARVLDEVGPLPLRLRPASFGTVLDIIVSQQISVAAASAIWGRLEAAGLVHQDRAAQADIEDFAACGLSRVKAHYASGIAKSGVDWAALHGAPDDEVRRTLLELRGVGPWTVEIFLLSALGRADAFPAGDLALQEAARLALGLDERPDPRALTAHAQAWAPFRAVAARALWAYYRRAKDREGIRA